MGLDFPDNPVIDDQFAPVGIDKVFTWNGELWVTSGGSGNAPPADYLPLTGGTLSGPLNLSGLPTTAPMASSKQYVDETISAMALYQGPWQVASNTPDLDPAVALPQHTYSWVAQTVDPLVAETAPASLPGIGGATVKSGDTVIWNANTSVYDHIQTPGFDTSTADARHLQLTGGTMTGGVDFAADDTPLNFNNVGSAGLYFNSTAGATRFRIVADDQHLLINAGGTGNCIDITRNGWVAVPIDGTGISFAGGGMIYKTSGAGMKLRKSSGGQQWQIENNDGSGDVNIATTALTRSVEDQISDAVRPLLDRIAKLETEVTALRGAGASPPPARRR